MIFNDLGRALPDRAYNVCRFQEIQQSKYVLNANKSLLLMLGIFVSSFLSRNSKGK